MDSILSHRIQKKKNTRDFPDSLPVIQGKETPLKAVSTDFNFVTVHGFKENQQKPDLNK